MDSETMEEHINEAFNALNLGGQIRQLRRRKRLTLKAVSDLTGLSKPLLSQIENSVTTPPIATLLKISRAFGVHIGHFFQESPIPDRLAVVRREDRVRTRRGGKRGRLDVGYHYQALSPPMAEKHMEPFLVEIDPREETDLVYYNHRGEEFIFVIEGEVEFRGNDKVVRLAAGDSLYFDSSIPHALRGLQEQPAKVLSTIYSPEPAATG